MCSKNRYDTSETPYLVTVTDDIVDGKVQKQSMTCMDEEDY